MLLTAAEPGVDMPCGGHPDTAVIAGLEHSDLAHSTRAVPVAAHVQDHLHRGVRVYRPGPAVMAGVECGKQIDDLGTARRG